jgi:hypothetical protein
MLVRPESAIFSGVLLLGYLVTSRGRRVTIVQRVGMYVVAPGLVFTALRVGYFEHLLPTPFYMKQSSELMGLTYILNFVKISVLGGAIFVVTVWVSGLRPRSIYMLILLAVLAQLAYFTTISPSVGQGFRFPLPFLPALVLVVSEHLRILLRAKFAGGFQIPSTPVQFLATYGPVTLLMLLLFSSFDIGNRRADLAGLENYFRLRLANPAIGEALKGISDQPQNVVLATGEAGAIPYITGFRHVDILGLTTETIAYDGFTPDAVFSANPDIFLSFGVIYTVQNGRVVPDQRYAGCLDDSSTTCVSYQTMVDQRFSDFSLIKAIKVPGTRVTYSVFGRRDSPYYDLIAQRLNELDIAPELARYSEKHSPAGGIRWLQFWRSGQD